VFSDNGNLTKTTQFNPIGKYSQSVTEGTYELQGNRMTKLGTNMCVVCGISYKNDCFYHNID